MTSTATLDATTPHPRDREMIRVDFYHDRMGIAAALRRAFSDAAAEPCDRDFADLVAKLN